MDAHAKAKACNTCKRMLPVSEFWKQKNKRDGLFGQCKECGRARNTAWYRANLEEVRPRLIAATYASRQRDPIGHVLKSIKHRCKVRGIEFSITRDDVPVPTHCPVLGIPLVRRLGEGGARKESGWRDALPSIDRIDPKRGYTPDNVLVESFRANMIKNNAAVEELYKIAMFYERLADDRGRESAGGRAQFEVAGLSADVPEMLGTPHEKA